MFASVGDTVSTWRNTRMGHNSALPVGEVLLVMTLRVCEVYSMAAWYLNRGEGPAIATPWGEWWGGLLAATLPLLILLLLLLLLYSLAVRACLQPPT